MKALRVDLGRPRSMHRAATAVAIALMLIAAAMAWNAHGLRSGLPPSNVPAVIDAGAASPTPLAQRPGAQDVEGWLGVAQSPWGVIFEAVEATEVPGVRVVRLDIDALARSVSIEVDAVDHARASAWFSALGEASPEIRWQLQQSLHSGDRVTATGTGRW